MEHIPDDKKAMHEIFRILKPGGRAILQVPYSHNNNATIETPEIADPLLQSKMYGQNDHVRIYNLDDYKARLQSSGFKVEIIPCSSLEHIYKYAIQENESFLVIIKPNS